MLCIIPISGFRFEWKRGLRFIVFRDGGRHARRNKGKEKSARFSVAQIKSTMRQGIKSLFRFFYISKGWKASSNLGKRCGEKVGERRFPYNQGNCGLQRPFPNRWHVACCRGERVNFKERSSPPEMEWTIQGRRQKKKSSRTTRNVTKCKQATAKKLEPKSLSQTVVCRRRQR